MFKNKILKKLGAGLMAGLCAFSMLGTNFNSSFGASAVSSSTENVAFPSADTVIAKAATLLGTPYTFGNKGYSGIYTQGAYAPLSVSTINSLGIDCSGLVYYTLTQLGYSTSGFSWNNPVPVDTAHWLTVSDSCTITYGGKTSNIDIENRTSKRRSTPTGNAPTAPPSRLVRWLWRRQKTSTMLGFTWANSIPETMWYPI